MIWYLTTVLEPTPPSNIQVQPSDESPVDDMSDEAIPASTNSDKVRFGTRWPREAIGHEKVFSWRFLHSHASYISVSLSKQIAFRATLDFSQGGEKDREVQVHEQLSGVVLLVTDNEHADFFVFVAPML